MCCMSLHGHWAEQGEGAEVVHGFEVCGERRAVCAWVGARIGVRRRKLRSRAPSAAPTHSVLSRNLHIVQRAVQLCYPNVWQRCRQQAKAAARLKDVLRRQRSNS